MHMAQYRSSGKELRKSPKGVIAALILVVLLAAGAFGIRMVLNGMESLVPEPVSEAEISVPDSETESSEDPNALKLTTFLYETEKLHHGPLVMINSDFPTTEIETGLVSVFEQKNEYITTRDMQVYLMDEATLALNQLAAKYFEATGRRDILVRNAYVSYDEQKQRYEAELAAAGTTSGVTAAIPGGNELESGYSFELGLYVNGMFMDYSPEGDAGWILEHCAEFGFVQRYPEGKSDYTHVDDQPWIFRYVGVPHSWYMYKNGLCLEEYLDLLESNPADGQHLTVKDQLGRSYELYYVSVDPNNPTIETDVPCPAECKYKISGNNKHGFFITAELGWDNQDTWTSGLS